MLGREHDGHLVVPWDTLISRQHVELEVGPARELQVRRLSTARNPLYYQGAACDVCTIPAGGYFVLGQTTFEWHVPQHGADTPAVPLVEELTFSREQLHAVRFRDADKRIEVLTHLPEVIWGARTDPELLTRLVNLLLAGIPQAEAAAIVEWQGGTLKILQWDRRRETAGQFRPSLRLVRDAVERQTQTVLHLWGPQPGQPAEYTVMADSDWAFCTPVRGPATIGWGLYLAGQRMRSLFPGDGRSTSSQALEGDVKFAELVAEIVSSVRRLRHLERQQSGLRQFFAPAVLNAVGDNLDSGLLAPRETDITILFCDLRGFSRQAEAGKQNLLGVLDRVSQAMGVMTRHILSYGGGIGDFLGDAALSFWGWPVSAPQGALDACRAALAIRAEFAAMNRQAEHPLANFQVGIGIAQGRAVAGKIGTSDLVKITVFGPVVNLASRLESMTKQLRVPILLDETVAEIVRQKLPAGEGRLRQLARVLPVGMETPLMVSELVPPFNGSRDLTDEQLAIYEKAVALFIAGDWERAYEELHQLPAEDKAQDFLTALIAQHNRMPPQGWDGVVRLPAK